MDVSQIKASNKQKEHVLEVGLKEKKKYQVHLTELQEYMEVSKEYFHLCQK